MLDYSQSKGEAKKFIVSADIDPKNNKKLLINFADGTANNKKSELDNSHLDRCYVSTRLMNQAIDNFKTIPLMSKLCKTLRVNTGLLFTLVGVSVALSVGATIATGNGTFTATGLGTSVGCMIGAYIQESRRKVYRQKIEELKKYKWFWEKGCAYLNAGNLDDLDEDTLASVLSGINEKDKAKIDEYYNPDNNAVHIDAMVVDRVSLESLEQLLCNMRLMLTYRDDKEELLNMERAKVMQFHMKV